MRSQLRATTTILLLILFFPAIVLAGNPTETNDPPGVPVGLEIPRDTNPQASSEDLETLVRGNNEFAFELYQRVRNEKDGNFFFSPHSMTLALAMTWAGARSDTETQMADTLHYRLGQQRTHTAMNALDLLLASRAQAPANDDEATPFELHIVNNLFGQTGYSFETDYLTVLARDYGAGLRLLDFQSDPEPCRADINDWIAEVTQDRIKDLLPEGSITTLTRLVLTNAIYFKAAWRTPFPEANTRPASFRLLSGETVTTPMMSNHAGYGLASTADAQVVSLPYVGEQLSMVLIVPDPESFDTVERSLTEQTVSDMVEGIQPTGIILNMPKWQTRTDLSLKPVLSEMGMPRAFDPSLADFSGMNGGTEQLFISDVAHQAWVAVNEEGTEAAAATAVVVGTTSLPPTVTIDRPFIYLIRDDTTGTILFLGRVLDPTS